MTPACPHAAHTLAALRCVSVPVAGAIRWRGEPIAPRLPDGPGMDELQIDLLAGVLYRQFYCHGRPLPLASGAETSREGLAALRLRAELVRANRAPPAWQGGWRARHDADGGIDAAQAGLRVHAPPGAWRPASGTADTAVDLKQSPGTFAASPGFYLVEGPPWLADDRLVRLYWHVSPAGAAPLLTALTGLLADSGLPFQVKVLARGTAYGRADACVLYLDHAHFAVLAGELARIHARMRPGLLTAAARIGAELSADAVWHGERCCWVGHLSGTGRPYGALGPALYDGTAGIAWFLAQLYAATGEARLRATAEGALRHACAAAEPHADTGLYSGLAGVAWVSARCADLLDLPEFAAGATRLRRALAGRASQAANADVLGGVAGVVLGLLGADADDADGLAHAYGNGLLRLAKRGPAYWTWTTINGRGLPALTGFAHGASGIASALAALHASTGDPAWQTAARAALAYEDACFDARAGNWPDLRSVRQRRFAPTASCAWCHGAGGVALARARLGQSAGPADRRALDAALATTRAAVLDALASDGALCLCHGLAGNADLLLLAGDASDRALAGQAAQHVLARYADTPAVERTPGLLTGSAGIGQFLLRLCDAGVLSPLWLGPAPAQT